jgi:hypothetical protein
MSSESLDIKFARLEEQVKSLTKQQEKLTEEVSTLVATMNKGKGAFGAAMVVAGAIGAVAAKGVSWFLNAQ